MLLMHIFLHTSVVQANRPVELQQDVDKIGKRANLSTKTPPLLQGNDFTFYFILFYFFQPSAKVLYWLFSLLNEQHCVAAAEGQKKHGREMNDRQEMTKRHLFTTQHTSTTQDRHGAVLPYPPVNNNSSNYGAGRRELRRGTLLVR